MFSRFKSGSSVPVKRPYLYGPLRVNEHGTFAWFKASEVAWFFTDAAHRRRVVDDLTYSFVSLADMGEVHFRITSLPFDERAWMAHHYAVRTAAQRGQDSEEEREGYLDRLNERAALVKQSGKAGFSPALYFGVKIGPRFSPQHLPDLLSYATHPHSDEFAKARDLYHRLAASLSRRGLAAVPINSVEQDWLVHRSRMLGIPVSPVNLTGDADVSDRMLSEQVDVTCEPYAPHVVVRGTHEGLTLSKYVSTVTMEHAEPRDDVDNMLWSDNFMPWLAYYGRMPFPVEISARVEVLSGMGLATAADRLVTRARKIKKHWEEDVKKEPPQHIQEGLDGAKRIAHEVRQGEADVATRIRGAWRFAVWGDTPQEAAQRVHEIVIASNKDEHIRLSHSVNRQYARYCEFDIDAVGDPRDYDRRFPVRFAAAAVPNASSTLGERNARAMIHGFEVGGGAETGVVLRDLHAGPMGDGVPEQSGLVTVFGSPGRGKSVFGGVALHDAAEAGYLSAGTDPSGNLARAFLRFPYLRKKLRILDMSAMKRGQVNPMTLVPEPHSANFDSPEEWFLASAEAREERRELLYDTLMLLLPHRLLSDYAATDELMLGSVNEAGGEYGTNPWEVVRILHREGSAHAKRIADYLTSAAESRSGGIIFPESRTLDHTKEIEEFGETLTIVSMEGLTTPPAGVDRAFWLQAERQAVPILHLASRLATRIMMHGGRDPKVVLGDEISIAAAGVSSYASSMLRISRLTRATNTVCIMITQNAKDMERISPEVNNLRGSGYVFGMADMDAAASALKVIDAPLGVGIERIATQLSVGQALVRDYMGRIGTVQHVFPDAMLDGFRSTPVERQIKRDLEVAARRLIEERDTSKWLTRGERVVA